jgi:hypothetical protein
MSLEQYVPPCTYSCATLVLCDTGFLTPWLPALRRRGPSSGVPSGSSTAHVRRPPRGRPSGCAALDRYDAIGHQHGFDTRGTAALVKR